MSVKKGATLKSCPKIRIKAFKEAPRTPGFFPPPNPAAVSCAHLPPVFTIFQPVYGDKVIRHSLKRAASYESIKRDTRFTG
ncbi:MAG: hypothetical protein H6937_09650 [Burkholderiales bacterium]|nr:hypothetical protein [Burkholderiales bacterium]